MTSTQQECCGERNVMITSIQDFYEQQLDSLSVRAINVLRQNRINEYSTLLNMATKPGFSFMKLNKIGKKTTKELDELVNRLLEYQKNNMNGDVNNEEKFVTDEQEETDVISKLNTPIVNLDVSVRALNCLREAEINTVGDLVAFNKADLLLFRSLGKKTLQEIENIVETMGFQFGMNVRQLVQGNDTKPSRVPDIIGIGVLSESNVDIDYICAFKEKYGYFPMVFLLYKSLNILTEYEQEVIKMHWGLSQTDNTISPMTIDEIASKLFLTRERIRQILEKALKRIRTSGTIKNLFLYEDWRVYKIDMDAPCIFPENIDTIRILDEHNFLVDYIRQNRMQEWSYKFVNDAPYISEASLYFILLMKGFHPFWLDKTRKELSKKWPNNESEPIYVFLDNRFCQYKFNKAISEVHRLQREKKSEDIIVSISSNFIDNELYWIDNINLTQTEKDTLIGLVCKLFQTLCGVSNCNGCVLLKANMVNYGEIVYKILKEANTRLYRNEIFSRVTEVCHKKGIESNITNSLQISSFLTKDPRIIPIGKSGYWGLKEWGEMIGSIRELSIKLVKQHRRAIHISDLIRLVMEARPDSNEKSVSSVIRQTTASGELLLFYDDYIGNPNAKYVKDYVLMPQTFDEWLKAFKNFVLKNKRYPFCNQDFEGYLYRWHYRTSQFTDLSAEEIVKFDSLEKELAHYPHNTLEYNFLHNCNLYKKFVEGNSRMLKESDDTELFKWFYKSSREYSTYNDNRNKYFSQLLQLLSNKLY